MPVVVAMEAEGEIIVLAVSEREKFKLQFNFMSASTPLEWRGGK